MPQKCDGCGVDAVEGEIFAPVTIPFSRKKSLCPHCQARRNRQWSQRWLVAYLAAGVIGFLLLRFVPAWQAFATFLFIFSLVQVFLLAATLPHELGHAFVGRWLGFDVQEIVIGYGTPFFRSRAFGFPFELRSVPLGGLTRMEKDARPWFRTRWFLMVLAGPAVNLFLAALLYQPSRLDLGYPGGINPFTLFIIANLFVVALNLLPLRTKASSGPASSDGLQLLNLLRGEKKKKTAAPAPESKPTGLSLVKVLGAIVLGLTAFVCFLLCLGVLLIANRTALPIVLFLLALFGGAGCYLVWTIIRLVRTPVQDLMGPTVTGARSGADPALSPYAVLLQQFDEDLDRVADFPESTSPPLFLNDLAGMLRRKDYPALDHFLREWLDKHPRNLRLQVSRYSSLCGQNRWNEAALLAETIGQWPELSPGSKAILKSHELRALVQANRFEEAAVRCEEYLAGSESIIAKVHLLDVLASLTHSENRPDYLPEADKWSQRALELAPGFITLKGTRGAVLADLGRFSEAEPFLREVFERSESDIDKGTSALYLALCAKAGGNRVKANTWAREAARILPQPWLLQKIQDEELAG